MAKIVTFGELMLRLAPPPHEMLLQTPVLTATFGGSEANVAVSLANYGEDIAFVSTLPRNEIGEAGLLELQKFGVSVNHIIRTDDRMGLYYTQNGSNMRPSKVIYDRENSAISLCKPGDFNWDVILDGAEWFFISGITPAISHSLYDLTLESLKKCREKGITIACDLNFRNNLWRWGKKATDVMPGIVKYVDVLIANEEDCQKSLGIELDIDIDAGKINPEEYRSLSQKLFENYPNLRYVAVSLRESINADYNGWSGVLADKKGFYISRKYEISDIVDRIGAGDSFSAGLIHGLRKFDVPQKAIEFAASASALKHTILGDFNRAKEADIEALMNGSFSGRVRR